MVRSDSACAGVMFSIDTESGFKDAVFITGAYGLGENVVQGIINPDEYYVFKPLLKNKKLIPIVGKVVGEKEKKMVYTKDKKRPVKNVFVPESEREQFVLTDDEILLLARWSNLIEDHYSSPLNPPIPHFLLVFSISCSSFFAAAPESMLSAATLIPSCMSGALRAA